jgi:hypothetical protein
MSRVHRQQQVECLAATDLPHHESIRPHAQRIAHELPEVDGTSPLDVRWTRLKTRHMPRLHRELCGVFDRDDPLIGGN